MLKALWANFYFRSAIITIARAFTVGIITGYGIARAKGYDGGFLALAKIVVVNVGSPAIAVVSSVFGIMAAIEGITRKGTITQGASRATIALMCGLAPAALFLLWISIKYGWR
jgi:hypothetical protein